MLNLEDLSDDEIDSLLLELFTGSARQAPTEANQRIEDKSLDDLLRIRSRNHPDKWPNVDLDAYRAAIAEMDRRRSRK